MKNSLRFVRHMTASYVTLLFLAACSTTKVQPQAGSKWAGDIAASPAP